MTRRGLLLTAVATVAAPGLVAMVAVLGHEHLGTAAAASAAALDGTSLAGAVAATATSPQVARTDVTVSRAATGIRLLESAATSSLTTSYQGTEAVSQSDVTGSAQTISRVWHQGGGNTLVETLNTVAPATTHPAVAQNTAIAVADNDPASGSPEGVFGVTKELVRLLGKHYTALYWGGGSVANRSTAVVELYRPNHTIAARYWLDSQTMMPLRRELYDTSGHEISNDSFLSIQIGAIVLPQLAGSSAATAQTARSWTAAAAPGTFVTSLAARGWEVPASSPGGLPLYAAASTTTSSGEVVDLEYSDGLYDISLFVERGTLAPEMPGWQPANLPGQRVYVSGPSVTWARDGFVYTMIDDVPPQTVTDAVNGVPEGSPGTVDRLGRGLVRLVHAVNPFD